MPKVKSKKPVKKSVQFPRLPLPERMRTVAFEELGPQWPPEPPGLQRSVTPAPTPSQVILVQPDPLDGHLGLVYIVAAQRMMEFAKQFPQEVQAETYVRAILARVAVRDPTVMLIVALDSDTGDVVGHVVVTIESYGTDRWAFVSQAQVDPNGTHILQQIFDACLPWAKQQGAASVLMATQLDPAFWEKKYGFERVRYVMRREI